MATRIYRSTNQSIPSSGDHDLIFNAVRLDDDGLFDPAEGDCVTIGEDGLYDLWANIKFQSSNAGLQRDLGFEINEADYVGYTRVPPSGGNATYMQASSLATPLKAGDKVRVVVHQDCGHALDVIAEPMISPEFAIGRNS